MILPNEILMNISYYLNLDDELKFIEIFNLPKRIPRKLNRNKIEKINNMLCKKFKIDKTMSKIFFCEDYIDLTHAFNSEYKQTILTIINTYLRFM
jgi:hypothetical protein